MIIQKQPQRCVRLGSLIVCYKGGGNCSQYQQQHQRSPPLWRSGAVMLATLSRRRCMNYLVPQLQQYPQQKFSRREIGSGCCYHNNNNNNNNTTTRSTNVTPITTCIYPRRRIVNTGCCRLGAIRFQSNTGTIRKTKQEKTTDSSSSTSTTGSTGTTDNIRISKLIATCTCSSRKHVERNIREGNVTLYGRVITSPATIVSLSELYQPNNIAALTINTKTVPLLQYRDTFVLPNNNNDSNNDSNTLVSLPQKRVRVWLVHKMAGELVTDLDPYKRPTVMSRIHTLGTYSKRTKQHEHIKIVGRLDMNTEGLLVVTNCGIYARQLELAKHMIHRTYRVRVHGRPLLPHQINAIQYGKVMIDTIRYPPMKIKYDDPSTMKNRNKRRKFKSSSSTSTNQWMTITCTQGKNRQIRKVLEYFRCTVTRLLRTSYGDYTLGTIPKGLVQEVDTVIPHLDHQKRGKLGFTNVNNNINNKKNTVTTTTTTTPRGTSRKESSQQQQQHNRKPQQENVVKPIPVQWIRM